MSAAVFLRALSLVVLANGVPLVARSLIGPRWSAPVDGNLRFLDGRPIFGQSKTIRGAALAILATGAAAPHFGLGWRTGIVFGSLAMAGDLFSSFCKRRLGLAPSSPALGLDQIPEALFPLVACRAALELTMAGAGATVAIFFAGEVLFSRLLYVFRLRERPY